MFNAIAFSPVFTIVRQNPNRRDNTDYAPVADQWHYHAILQRDLILFGIIFTITIGLHLHLYYPAEDDLEEDLTKQNSIIEEAIEETAVNSDDDSAQELLILDNEIDTQIASNVTWEQFRTFLEEDDITFPSPTSINHGLTRYVHRYRRIPTIVSWAEWMEAQHGWFTGRFDDEYQGLTAYESQLINDAAPHDDLDTYWICRELGIPRDEWR